MNIPLSPCVPENLVSRDGFSRPVPRQPAHLHTQAESGAYLRDSSRVPSESFYATRIDPPKGGSMILVTKTSLCMYICMNVCMYVYLFIKLHINAQSGPVIRVILCHSH